MRMLGAVVLGMLLSTGLASAKEKGYCNAGKECKIYEAINLNGKVCMDFRGDDGQPISTHMRRVSDGKPRDLDYHVGRCLTLRGCTYRVYIIAEKGPVHWRVYKESVSPGCIPGG